MKNLSDLSFEAGPNASRYVMPADWAATVGYDPQLHDDLDAVVTPPVRRCLLPTLRNKTLLLLGDSTDSNVWAELCHCVGEVMHGRPAVVGNLSIPLATCERSIRVDKIDKTHSFRTCHYPAINFTVHAAGVEFLLHPWGQIPHGRGVTPRYTSAHDLDACIKLKLSVIMNNVGSLIGSAPNLAILNPPNLWV